MKAAEDRYDRRVLLGGGAANGARELRVPLLEEGDEQQPRDEHRQPGGRCGEEEGGDDGEGDDLSGGDGGGGGGVELYGGRLERVEKGGERCKGQRRLERKGGRVADQREEEADEHLGLDEVLDADRPLALEQQLRTRHVRRVERARQRAAKVLYDGGPASGERRDEVSHRLLRQLPHSREEGARVRVAQHDGHALLQSHAGRALHLRADQVCDQRAGRRLLERGGPAAPA
mmetsp:Transcript_43505/g.137182  ORF Transcript_43505/g.137182 Transcript_43505/m.137182 type:complete len:231 (-) Transcript_43505:18-710(-)